MGCTQQMYEPYGGIRQKVRSSKRMSSLDDYDVGLGEEKEVPGAL
jgi:hypothetical protein